MAEPYLTVNDPFLVGEGPVTFSTSLEIALRLRIVWDTNGYYRELGVRHDASKAQIKEAYQRLKGWRSPRLTYVFKQLLDPNIRAAYDSTPLGEVFHDAYIEDAMRRSLARKVANLKGQGRREEAEFIQDLYDSPFTDEVDEFGVRVERPYDSGRWKWSYYLWQSSCQDTEKLREWQEALVSALGPRKEHHQIAIGFLGTGGTLPWKVHKVGYRTVVFLNDGETPRESLAVEAASQVIEQARGDK